MPFEPVSSLIIQAAYVLNFFLGALYLFGRMNMDRLLGVLLLIISFVPYQFELIYTKQLFYYPVFFLTYIPPILWFGPIMYYFVQHRVFNQPLTKVQLLRHGILPIISTIAIVPMILTPSDDKLALINQLYYETVSFEYNFISIICVASIVFYAVVLFQYLPTIARAKTKTTLFFLMFSITTIGVIFSAISLSSLLTHSLNVLFWGNLFFSVVVLVATTLHIRYNDFLPLLLTEIKETKDRKSTLMSINIERALANLNYVMQTEKIYIDPDLSLRSLAEKINLNPHQLSELLNHEVGKNFNSYIMDFRVNDAIKALKNEPNKTILAIALDVGFNSNSAFYTAFKKVTGKSPSDYREE